MRQIGRSESLRQIGSPSYEALSESDKLQASKLSSGLPLTVVILCKLTVLSPRAFP